MTKKPRRHVYCSINRLCQVLIGLSWAANGIFFPKNQSGESTGEAYCQFDTFTNANAAMDRNKECIGGRYIELFRSSNSEMRRAMINDARNRKDQFGNKTSTYSGRQRAGGMSWAGLQMSAGANQYMHQKSQNNMNNVAMGGLNMGNGDMGNQNGKVESGNANNFAQNRPAPYQKPAAVAPPQSSQVATGNNNSPFPHVVGVQGIETGIVNSQIQEFFKPAKAIAINMLGSGYCDVAFKTHDDALQAMEKDRMPLQGSAINLTLKSQPPGQSWSVM